MNVFDDEAGALCEQQESERIAMLSSLLTLEEYRAWERLKNQEVN